MGHNPHPHGQSVVQPHELKDHIMEQNGGQGGKVAKLPDSKRESWMTEHPYPNSMNPEPPTSKKVG
jgi:hypothetical protein